MNALCLRVNVTFYDAVNMIHDVITTPALRSIKENVRERSPTVRLISTVRGERLQPIANAF